MIKSLEELTDFLKICRKQGVTEIKFGEVSVSFGALPMKRREASEQQEIPTDEMSPEELMFYSAGIPINEDQKGQ